MSIFFRKKGKVNPSRIPYGNSVLKRYIIRPYTNTLFLNINEHLDLLLESTPMCVDGQNGDVLDKYIECWKDRAKANLRIQRAGHQNDIKMLSSIRNANRSNAMDWLNEDQIELQKIKDELDELERQSRNYNNQMINW